MALAAASGLKGFLISEMFQLNPIIRCDPLPNIEPRKLGPKTFSTAGCCRAAEIMDTA
jgi:hypothetical protein